jgi:hypothetical protein
MNMIHEFEEWKEMDFTKFDKNTLFRFLIYILEDWEKERKEFVNDLLEYRKKLIFSQCNTVAFDKIIDKYKNVEEK